MRDALRNVHPRKPDVDLPELYGLVFFHRGELLRNREVLRKTIEAVIEIAGFVPLVLIFDPVAKGYLVRYGLFAELERVESITLLPKLPYEEFEWLLRSTAFLISDSPGQQQEARELGVPCLVHRKFVEETPTSDESHSLSGWDLNSFVEFARSNLKQVETLRSVSESSPSAVVAQSLSGFFNE